MYVLYIVHCTVSIHQSSVCESPSHYFFAPTEPLLSLDTGDEVGEPVRHGPQDAVQLRHLRRQRLLQPQGLAGLVQGIREKIC